MSATSTPPPAQASRSSYDAIVIGGGHNGLINACYLAKAGLRVVVLERRGIVGGAAITEELVPGYKFTTFSYALSLLRPDIIQDLGLTDHGLMTLPFAAEFHAAPDGEYLLLGTDEDQNFHELARHSPADAEAYRDYYHLLDRLRHAVRPVLDDIPPNPQSDDPIEQQRVTEFNAFIDGLEPDVSKLLQRLWTGSIAEVLDEWFESELLKGLIASSSIIGSMCGPRSPESGIVYLLHVLGERDGVFGEWGFHKGGNGGFTEVLVRAAEAFGVEIVVDQSVTDIVESEGRAQGVRLAGGAELHAGIVVSSLDPKRTFTELVDPATMPDELVQAISKFKFQGAASKVNFALDAPPTYPGLDHGPEVFRGFVNIGPTLDYLEEAFADASAGRISRRPFLDCCVQSVVDPDMTPPGKHIMSCFVMYTPYHLADGGWDDEMRERLGDIVAETLEEVFPGFTDLVLHREVVTPADIERIVGITEGNIFHGELFDSQMFFNRPAPGWNQYRTPLSGYYQCGSGTHPGGCVMGGPGKLAARQILADNENRSRFP